jgi:tetratricopeptide (TPR) repeat protein
VNRPLQCDPERQPAADTICANKKALSVCVFLLAATLISRAEIARAGENQPVNCAQVMAWLISGVPSTRVVRIVQERGILQAPGKNDLHNLEAAGADPVLLRAVGRPHESATSSSPKSTIPVFLLQAALDARSQRFHQAESALRRNLGGDPKNAALHFALGAMLREQERWDEAFNEFTLAAELMPDFPENHSNLAYIFYRVDDGPNAIAEARTALSMDPQNAEAYRFLGLALYSTGQYGASTHAFVESLAREAANPDTYYDLGITLHADGKLDNAIAAYRQAIHLQPAHWQAHANLAMILHEQSKLDEAIAEYREARRLAPQEASVRNNLGNTYCDKGDFDAAIEELRELYRQHPEWQEGHSCLAQAYLSKKDLSGAINQLQLAVRLNPRSSPEHRVLGETLLLNDRVEEGVRELQTAVALDPDADVSHRALGSAFFQQRRLPAAEKEFREALRLHPSPENHYALAACLMTMDRYQEALAELETAAQLDPDRQLYRARRDELLKLIGESNAR